MRCSYGPAGRANARDGSLFVEQISSSGGLLRRLLNCDSSHLVRAYVDGSQRANPTSAGISDLLPYGCSI